MAFRAIDEGDTIPACEWADRDGDGQRYWSCKGSCKESEEVEECEGLHVGVETDA